MNKMNNSRGTPNKGSQNKYYYSTFDDANHDQPEIRQPNPSTATPAVPDEMPARDIR
jgi:hypothetical protein